MQQFTDKKSRSTRRALLRFLKLYDYGYYDIAIEISDIIRRDPFSLRCTKAAIVAILVYYGFESVILRDSRALRIVSQIKDEHFRQSGMTGGAPFVSILPPKALCAAIGLSNEVEIPRLDNQKSKFRIIIRAPDLKNWHKVL